MNGRLYFVPLAEVTVLDLSPEEAFKIILSSGNYVPEEIGRRTRLGQASDLRKEMETGRADPVAS